MADCCANGLNQVFCNAFNKYYNTLYTNGEISKEETNNLLIIDYIRLCLSDDRYSSYYNILLKALRCIANNSCLLDTSWLYDRSIVPKVTNLFVTVLNKLPFVEKDPIFMASPAATITTEEIYNWNHPVAQGTLIVTVDPYSLLDNPTYNEVYTAWSSGLDVVARLGDDSGIFQLSYIDDGTIMFIRSDNWNGIYIQYLLLEVVGNNETWTLSSANYLAANIPQTSTIPANLAPNTMYNYGTVSSALTIPNLSSTGLLNGYVNFYALYFTAGADNILITFPTGVQVDDTPTINTGDYVEIMIMNNHASIKIWQAQ